MDHNEIVTAAYKAGCVVCPKWIDRLSAPDQPRSNDLAVFIDAHGAPPAEAVYNFAVGPDAAERPWAAAPPALRAAVMVFEATYRVLKKEFAASEESATRGPQRSAYAARRAQAERVTDDRADGMGDRVVELMPRRRFAPALLTISEAHLALPELTHDDAEALGLIRLDVHPGQSLERPGEIFPIAKTLGEKSYTLWFEAGAPDVS